MAVDGMSGGESPSPKTEDEESGGKKEDDDAGQDEGSKEEEEEEDAGLEEDGGKGVRVCTSGDGIASPLYC